jgi:hypothetical protein
MWEKCNELPNLLLLMYQDLTSYVALERVKGEYKGAVSVTSRKNCLEGSNCERKDER